jgi:H+/Cl- antiporter ClcA
MTKRQLAYALVVLVVVSSAYAAATCTVNGRDVPCDQFWDDYGWLFGAMGIFWVIAMVFALIGTIFWVWMLVDCANRSFKQKTKWIVIIAVLNIIGAVAYYLIIKRKGK